MLLPLLLALLIENPTPGEPLKGSDLPLVTGPMAPGGGDPAAGFGADRSGLQTRRAARQGSILTVAVPADATRIADRILYPSGWKAYRLEIPARGKLLARLRSDRESNFLLRVINRWGRMEEGMLQNRIYRGRPEASYFNPKDAPNTIYVIVDTRDTNASEPYVLEFTQEP
ncbi:MAG TPA: hypothetical protein PKL14_11095 [Holophaga sp.]|jgi:hypothetical protein|nr:hypothetical protein [Holophaga sp.]